MDFVRHSLNDMSNYKREDDYHITHYFENQLQTLEQDIANFEYEHGTTSIEEVIEHLNNTKDESKQKMWQNMLNQMLIKIEGLAHKFVTEF